MSDRKAGIICGMTANTSVLILFAPLAFNDSTALKSRPSISSAKSFPSIPTEWIPKTNLQHENEPGPTALINISAITISGKTRITLKINLLTPETGRSFTILFAPRNANGIQIIAAMKVPTTAIAKVSSKPRNRLAIWYIDIADIRMDKSAEYGF